jgi:hypothetical protein
LTRDNQTLRLYDMQKGAWSDPAQYDCLGLLGHHISSNGSLCVPDNPRGCIPIIDHLLGNPSCEYFKKRVGIQPCANGSNFECSCSFYQPGQVDRQQTVCAYSLPIENLESPSVISAFHT